MDMEKIRPNKTCVIIDDHKMFAEVLKDYIGIYVKNVDLYCDVNLFFKNMSSYSSDTIFFIDYNLNCGGTSVDFIKKLIRNGFLNVNILSGHIADECDIPIGVKHILKNNINKIKDIVLNS